MKFGPTIDYGVNSLNDMKIQKVIFLFLSLWAIVVKAQPFPKASISNGVVKSTLLLPDSEVGYYRGSRFDWSGVISSLEWNGHQYFGQWFEKYRPTLHDAIMGPVEAFTPIGYDEAKVGEAFLVIGVGMVTKPEESKYSIVTEYPIVHGGKWKTKSKADHVDFTHRFKSSDYSYDYKKTVQLIQGKPEMVILHTLKNAGAKTIETSVYNHNFFVMDNTPIGPGYEVKFPYKISGVARENPDLVLVEDNHIVLVKDIAPKKYLYFVDIERHSNDINDYNFSIENHKTGAAVKITGDQPILKLPMWSAIKTICPEPYIKLNIPPGKTMSWTIRYEFYECEKLK